MWIAEVPRIEDLIAQAGTFISRYPRLAVCSKAVLDGYEILPTGRSPHYTVVLPSVEPEELEKLRDCFLIIPNPQVND
jgi:hypothetical protein